MFQFLGLSLSSLIIFVFMRLQKKPEEVAWLDVPVDDLLVVEVLEPEHNVTEGQPRGPLLQRVLCRDLVHDLVGRTK